MATENTRTVLGDPAAKSAGARAFAAHSVEEKIKPAYEHKNRKNRELERAQSPTGVCAYLWYEVYMHMRE